ncbi:hypothetical protein M0R45_036228 [Rubus argutus]|uniref:Uncharacterized protein n=1 Tax=Rubus argutus TaxID=59490 RepID=A0AAW1VWE9_RUBAR
MSMDGCDGTGRLEQKRQRSSAGIGDGWASWIWQGDASWARTDSGRRHDGLVLLATARTAAAERGKVSTVRKERRRIDGDDGLSSTELGREEVRFCNLMSTSSSGKVAMASEWKWKARQKQSGNDKSWIAWFEHGLEVNKEKRR